MIIMRMDKNGKYIKDEKHKSKNKPEMIMFTTEVGPSSPMIRCDKTEAKISDFTGLYDYVKDNNLNYKVGDTVKAKRYSPNSMLTCVGSGTSGDIQPKVDNKPDNVYIDELNTFKEISSTATYQKKVYEVQMKINAVFDKYAGHKLDSYLIDKIFNDAYNILSSPEIHKVTAYDILMDVSKRIHDKLNNDYANPPKYYDDKIVLSYLNYFAILMNTKE